MFKVTAYYNASDPDEQVVGLAFLRSNGSIIASIGTTSSNDFNVSTRSNSPTGVGYLGYLWIHSANDQIRKIDFHWIRKFFIINIAPNQDLDSMKIPTKSEDRYWPKLHNKAVSSIVITQPFNGSVQFCLCRHRLRNDLFRVTSRRQIFTLSF